MSFEFWTRLSSAVILFQQSWHFSCKLVFAQYHIKSHSRIFPAGVLSCLLYVTSWGTRTYFNDFKKDFCILMCIEVCNFSLQDKPSASSKFYVAVIGDLAIYLLSTISDCVWYLLILTRIDYTKSCVKTIHMDSLECSAKNFGVFLHIALILI